MDLPHQLYSQYSRLLSPCSRAELAVPLQNLSVYLVSSISLKRSVQTWAGTIYGCEESGRMVLNGDKDHLQIYMSASDVQASNVPMDLLSEELSVFLGILTPEKKKIITYVLILNNLVDIEDMLEREKIEFEGQSLGRMQKLSATESDSVQVVVSTSRDLDQAHAASMTSFTFQSGSATLLQSLCNQPFPSPRGWQPSATESTPQHNAFETRTLLSALLDVSSGSTNKLPPPADSTSVAPGSQLQWQREQETGFLGEHIVSNGPLSGEYNLHHSTY